MNAASALLALVYAASADPVPAGPQLRARLDAAPTTHIGARFAVRARLDSAPPAPAPARVDAEPDPPMRVDARLTAKAELASCVASGAIFRDGFENP